MNMIHENPEIRWSFIRKVYSIVAFQLLLTIVVAYILIFVPPVANFFNNYLSVYVHTIVVMFGTSSDLLSSSS
jgi:FtsH-binding integral membrane protein